MHDTLVALSDLIDTAIASTDNAWAGLSALIGIEVETFFSIWFAIGLFSLVYPWYGNGPEEKLLVHAPLVIVAFAFITSVPHEGEDLLKGLMFVFCFLSAVFLYFVKIAVFIKSGAFKRTASSAAPDDAPPKTSE